LIEVKNESVRIHSIEPMNNTVLRACGLRKASVPARSSVPREVARKLSRIEVAASATLDCFTSFAMTKRA
jgi:hypothetical protein